MYILFLMSFAWVLIFLISLIFSLLIKTTFFKKLAIFTLSFVFLRVFIFDYLISSFGVDLHPKVDKYPIIYSNSGAKLHVDNFCDSRKYGDGAFTAYKINLNQLINSNGKEIKCVAHIDYDNNELSFESDTLGSTAWLERDLVSFGYEHLERKGKYDLYHYYDIGEKRTATSLPEKKIFTYISNDGYRVRIDQNLKDNNKYSVSRRIYENFEVHYKFKRNVKSLAELEKIDNIIISYALSISRRKK